MHSAWQGLKHFKPDSKIDKWGAPEKIDPFLLQFLDEFTEAANTKIVVTSGWRKGDAAQHGLGRAVDIVAPDWVESLFDLYLLAERFGFTGIGLYRDWLYNGRRIGGLHLDTRLIVGKNNPALKTARWTCVRDGSEGMTKPEDILKHPQVYKLMNLATLRKEGFV